MQVFADDTGKLLQHRKNTTLRHVQDLYLKFHDLAIDLRSTSGNAAQASTFRDRVLTFLHPFQRVALQECTHKVTYIHLLSDHIPTWMVLWCELLGMGYGVFTSTSSEHLNKLIKFLELGHTNLSGNRFEQIIRWLRVRALHFPVMLINSTRNQTCSRCHQPGHNRKKQVLPSSSVSALPRVL